ncbi:Double zinc ribbon [Lachnospiraceae bacterium KH1T2]|nr:Double zinc ribbon [Lachnospiraceae bacterium KH1T2]
MKCTNCGAELAEGSVFCRDCGKKLGGQSTKKFCRDCGAEVKDDSGICSNCGAKLKANYDSLLQNGDKGKKIDGIGGKHRYSFKEEAEVQKERINNKSLKKYIAIGVAVIVMIFATISYSKGNNKENVVTSLHIPIGAEECKGKNYTEINDQLTKSGFTNITVNKIEDLKPSETERLNQIEEITVGGEATFAKDTMYDSDTEIIVNYHGYAKCAVKLHVDCVANLLFNKYDVDIRIDGESKGELPHGKSVDYELALEPGNHTVEFVSKDSSSVKGEDTLDVNGDVNISYKISCEGEKISSEIEYVEKLGDVGENEVMVTSDAASYYGKNYKDVEAEFKALGFTNIDYDVMYDIVFGVTNEGEIESVSIGGKTDFKRGDIFPKDNDVVIHYHMKTEANPDNDAVSTEIGNEQAASEKQEEDLSNTEEDTNIFAYVIKCKDYSNYYLFDLNNNIVKQFATNDKSVLVGDIIDITDTSYTINYNIEENYRETFEFNPSGTRAILNLNGSQYEYEKTSVNEAEAVLNQPGYHEMK